MVNVAVLVIVRNVSYNAGCETEQVGDPTFQARMDALAPVWSQLAGIGIQEEDVCAVGCSIDLSR